MDVTFFRGRLGADAETINAPGGVVGTKFRLGVNDSYRDVHGKLVERDTVWISCEAWRKTAVTALPVLVKGCAVIVLGKWRASTWDAEDGSKRTRNVFHVEGVGVDVGAMEVTGVTKRQAPAKAEPVIAAPPAPAPAVPAAPPPPAAPPAVAAPDVESAPNPFLVGEGE